MRKATARKAFICLIGALVSWLVLSGRWLIVAAWISVISVLWHRPIRYEVPENFEGWVVITFENPNCRPMDSDGVFLVIKFDKSGRACTSDSDPEGWRYTTLNYVDKTGRLKSAPSEMLAGASYDRQELHQYPGEFFFVGTAEQLKGAWSSSPH
jgi:hypothetical protein